jgi:hypothetical protein
MTSIEKYSPLTNSHKTIYITFRLCKRPSLCEIDKVHLFLTHKIPNDIMGLILYHFDMVYLWKFLGVSKSFYNLLNPQDRKTYVCYRNDIDPKPLDQLYDRFEVSYLSCLKPTNDKLLATTNNLIMCDGYWPSKINPKKVNHVSWALPSLINTLPRQLYKCENLMGIDLTNCSGKFKTDYVHLNWCRSKFSKPLHMSLALNIRPDIQITLLKTKNLHIVVSLGCLPYSDNFQDYSIYHKHIKKNFAETLYFPDDLKFCGRIWISECPNLESL